jgi:hypothetical protein
VLEVPYLCQGNPQIHKLAQQYQRLLLLHLEREEKLIRYAANKGIMINGYVMIQTVKSGAVNFVFIYAQGLQIDTEMIPDTGQHELSSGISRQT